MPDFSKVFPNPYNIILHTPSSSYSQPFKPEKHFRTVADFNQGLWLQQAYQLEFLGKSTFFPGLFVAGLAFFAVNCWILGIMVADIGDRSGLEEEGGGKRVGGDSVMHKKKE